MYFSLVLKLITTKYCDFPHIFSGAKMCPSFRPMREGHIFNTNSFKWTLNLFWRLKNIKTSVVRVFGRVKIGGWGWGSHHELAPFLFIEIGIRIEPWELLFCYNFSIWNWNHEKNFLEKRVKIFRWKSWFFFLSKKKSRLNFIGKY